MNSELVQEIKETAQKAAESIHTAVPGTIVDVSGTRFTVKSDGLIQADCKKFVINVSDSFKVNAGRIDLN